MKCPWLINTVTETNNRNSYNDVRRSEKQEFGTCVEKLCPFHSQAHGCTRAIKNKPQE